MTRDPERARKVAWSGIVDNKVSQSVKLFTTFMLFFTKMIVAHHNILSVYDIVLNRWTNHYALPAPIRTVWRILMDHENDKYEGGILLRNNQVHKLINFKESKNADFKIVLGE